MGSSGSSKLINNRNGKHSVSLLSRDQVDPVFTEPFIVGGYRRPHTSFAQCVQYAFTLHNDVANFWTHFIPLIVWLLWFWGLVSSWEDFFQPFQYPLICFWAGSCSYALFSSIAHLFSSKSFEVRSICFMLDYLGISMYAVGADIAANFYLNPCSSPFYAHKPFFITILVCLSISSTLVCSLTRFYWRKQRFVIRACSYVFPYTCAVWPFFHRLGLCWMYGTDCVPETIHLHCLAFFFTFLLLIFFVTKIPERFAPGRFDYFFHSHQLFHLCSVGLTSTEMYFTPLEMVLRQEPLSHVEGSLPSWETTFFPFLCAELGGLIVVCVLGVLCCHGKLSTNKAAAHNNHKKD